MSQAKCISVFVVVAVVLSLFSGCAMAQTTAPASCAASTNLVVNGTLIAGDWYEMARNPAPTFSFNCVKLNVTEVNSTTHTYSIATTYAGNVNALNKNNTFTNAINLTDAQNTAGFQLNFTNPGAPTVPVTFKILATDYNNYAFICGYTNATDNSTAFGIVLARDRELNSTQLNSYEMQASMSYSDFLSSNMSLINQTAACYTGGAATQVPVMATIFTMIYAVLKFMH